MIEPENKRMASMVSDSNDQHGFTLLELMVVIVSIIILVSLILLFR
ncbi:MAG TPA: prepilin-type N-terminal cleavage/methylation domain-containing protein [Candidatus Saccharimonadales bacterium]|nr:prepilin-type N-terminal cleavage/methylation domain-containing protein [Candidatus Saccharimonadales bacterium]